MEVDFYAQGMSDVVDRDALLTRVAGGLQFGEGPLWDKRTNSLIFTDIISSRIHRWTPGVGLETIVAQTGHANGTTFDRQGRLLVAGWSSRTVWRRDQDGSLVTIASHYEGKKLNTPNDIVVRSDGSIYFTDSDGGLFIPGMEGEDLQKYLDVSGVYRIGPDGSLHLVITDCAFPNGVAFSPDEKLLYVSDTWQGNIMVYDVNADGSTGNGRQFHKLTGPEPGHADGLKIDSRGNVYSTGSKGVHVPDPAGTLLGRIHVPEETTNLAWGGDDWKTLFITTFHHVYSTRLKIPGVAPW
jgi:gluconolactonase